MLLIDSREPESIRSLFDGSRVVTLAVGDFLDPTSGLLIERKSANDLLAALGDGRLYSQCARMVEVAKHPVLLIHGSLLPNRESKVVADGRTTRWSYWSMMNALLSVQTGGVPIYHVPTSLLVEAVDALRKWVRKPAHRVVRKPRGIWDRPSDQEELMALLTGSLRRGRILLAHYGSPNNALSHLDHWPKLVNVGIGTVKHAKKVLNGGTL